MRPWYSPFGVYRTCRVCGVYFVANDTKQWFEHDAVHTCLDCRNKEDAQ